MTGPNANLRMNIILAYLRLVRLPNLLIVAFTQYLVYGALLRPAFDQYNISLALPPRTFWLFVLDTLLVTAGGYIINDLVDFRTDLANRPEKVVLGRYIRKQTAYWLYFSVNIMGFLLAFYLALSVGQPPLVGLYPLAALLLYAYSAKLKKQPLSGNLLISLFCAAVPGIVWFAERAGFADLSAKAPARAGEIAVLLFWYLSFAFWSTLYRELIKDMEDVGGDRQTGCRTVAVAWGMGVAKGVAAATGLSLLVIVVAMAYREAELFTPLSRVYLGVALLLPVGLSLFLLFRAETSAHYHRLSTLAKLIMLSGLLLLLFLIL